jgi:hypothetical protein
VAGPVLIASTMAVADSALAGWPILPGDGFTPANGAPDRVLATGQLIDQSVGLLQPGAVAGTGLESTTFRTTGTEGAGPCRTSCRSARCQLQPLVLPQDSHT